MDSLNYHYSFANYSANSKQFRNEKDIADIDFIQTNQKNPLPFIDYCLRSQVFDDKSSPGVIGTQTATKPITLSQQLAELEKSNFMIANFCRFFEANFYPFLMSLGLCMNENHIPTVNSRSSRINDIFNKIGIINFSDESIVSFFDDQEKLKYAKSNIDGIIFFISPNTNLIYKPFIFRNNNIMHAQIILLVNPNQGYIFDPSCFDYCITPYNYYPLRFERKPTLIAPCIQLCTFSLTGDKWIPNINEDNYGTLVSYFFGSSKPVRIDHLTVPLTSAPRKIIGFVGCFGDIVRILKNEDKGKDGLSAGDSLVEFCKQISSPSIIAVTLVTVYVILYIPNGYQPNCAQFVECSMFAYQWMKRVCSRVVLVPHFSNENVPRLHFLNAIGGFTQAMRQKDSFYHGCYSTFTITTREYCGVKPLTFKTMSHFINWERWMSNFFNIEFNSGFSGINKSPRIPPKEAVSSVKPGDVDPSYKFISQKMSISVSEDLVKILSDSLAKKKDVNERVEKPKFIIQSIRSYEDGCIVMKTENESYNPVNYEFNRVIDTSKKNTSSNQSSSPVVSSKIAELCRIDPSITIVNSFAVKEGVIVISKSQPIGSNNNKVKDRDTQYDNSKESGKFSKIFVHLLPNGFSDNCPPNEIISLNHFENENVDFSLSASYSHLSNLLLIVHRVDSFDTLTSIPLDEKFQLKSNEVYSRHLCDFWPIIKDREMYKEPKMGGINVREDGHFGYLTFRLNSKNDDFSKQMNVISIFDPFELRPLKSQKLGQNSQASPQDQITFTTPIPLYSSDSALYLFSMSDLPDPNDKSYKKYQIIVYPLEESGVGEGSGRGNIFSRTFDLKYDKDVTITEVLGICSYSHCPLVVYNPRSFSANFNYEPILFPSALEFEDNTDDEQTNKNRNSSLTSIDEENKSNNDEKNVTSSFDLKGVARFYDNTIRKFGFSEIDYSVNSFSPLELSTLCTIAADKDDVRDLVEELQTFSYRTNVVLLSDTKHVVKNYNSNDSESVGGVIDAWFSKEKTRVPNSYLLNIFMRFLLFTKFTVLTPIIDTVTLSHTTDDDYLYNYLVDQRELSFPPFSFLRMQKSKEEVGKEIADFLNFSSEAETTTKKTAPIREPLAFAAPAFIVSVIDSGNNNKGSSVLSSLIGVPFSNSPDNTLSIGSNVVPILKSTDQKSNQFSSLQQIDNDQVSNTLNVIGCLYSTEHDNIYHTIAAFISAAFGSDSIVIAFDTVDRVIDFFNNMDMIFDTFVSESAMITFDRITTISIICNLGSNQRERCDYIIKHIEGLSSLQKDNRGQFYSLMENSIIKIFSSCEDPIDLAHRLVTEGNILALDLSKETVGQYRDVFETIVVLRKMSSLFGAQIDYSLSP